VTRYLLSMYRDKHAMYLPVKSDAEIAVLAILMEDFVLKLSVQGNRMDLVAKLMQELIAPKLVPHCLVLDGYFHVDNKVATEVNEAQWYQQQYQNDTTPFEVEFFAVTSSVNYDGAGFCENICTSASWQLDQYIAFINALYDAKKHLDPKMLSNLGCEVTATKQHIFEAIEKKFPTAGLSCRFMFDYSTTDVFEKLNKACSRVKGMRAGAASIRTVNTLVVKWSRNSLTMMPVSDLAATLLCANQLIDTTFTAAFPVTLAAVQDKHSAMVGWLFEKDIIDRLKASVPRAELSVFGACTAVAITGRQKVSISMDGKAGLIAAAEQISFLDVKSDVNAMPPFELLSARSRSSTSSTSSSSASTAPRHSFTMPRREHLGHWVVFRDWKDLVDILAKRSAEPWAEMGPLWLVPESYYNPFFDFAMAVWEDDGLVIYTFQATVSTTHSCKALIMQLVSNELFHREGNSLVLKKVIHHAVLPSQHIADQFSFDTNKTEYLKDTRMTLRSSSGNSSKKRVRAEAFTTALGAGNLPERDDMEVDVELSQDDVDKIQPVVEKEGQFKWTEVIIEESLVLQNALSEMYGMINTA
jgi:hypothetical protein